MKYLRYTALTLLTLAFSIFAYLTLPAGGFVPQEEYPSDPPVAVATQTRCKPDTLYVDDSEQGYSDYEVVDAHCFELQRKLAEAAASGNLKEMQEQIRKGASVNSPGSYSGDFVQPLIPAVWNLQTASVKMLLDNGGDANHSYYCCMSDRSLLEMAVGHDDLPMIKLLISRGANVNFVGAFGQSVLEEAASSQNLQTRELIEAACDRNLRCRVKLRARKILSLIKRPISTD